MKRRAFVKGAVLTVAAAASSLVAFGCSMGEQSGVVSAVDAGVSEGRSDWVGEQSAENTNTIKKLPPADPDSDNDYGVDRLINIETIDEWLDRDDVAYRDVRMPFDPADFAAIGGTPDLTATIEGFTVVPLPLLATLPPLPVSGAYKGPTAWKAEWADEGDIVSADPVYWESEQLLEDLFPKDKAIFIMCGAGAYASLAKKLLVHLGWDADRIYNVGGFWSYVGSRKIDTIVPSEDSLDGRLCFMWRAEVASIDFMRMHLR